MNEEDVFNRLRDSNHWRVVIRPTAFAAKRVPTLSDCWDIIDGSGVRLRSRIRPYVDHGYRQSGADWVQSGYPVPGERQEIWRFYQSGMFVMYFPFWEDFQDLPWRSSQFPPLGRPKKYLEWASTLYRITELLEFAARLAEKDVLTPRVCLSLGLHGLSGRYLTSWDTSMDFELTNMFKQPELTFEAHYNQSELLSSSDVLAAAASAYFF